MVIKLAEINPDQPISYISCQVTIFFIFIILIEYKI